MSSVSQNKETRSWRSGVHGCVYELIVLSKTLLQEGKLHERVLQIMKILFGKKDLICSNLQAAQTSQGQCISTMEALEKLLWLSTVATFSFCKKRYSLSHQVTTLKCTMFPHHCVERRTDASEYSSLSLTSVDRRNCLHSSSRYSQQLHLSLPPSAVTRNQSAYQNLLRVTGFCFYPLWFHLTAIY